ncbi:methyltransferase [Streptomyces abikoensis]|uniref:methyltransferase n=1 Tax=Streptomyces abikoensis TaxID=97398 RepID=UPI0016719DA6|nr:methyltransferase [Streptomyces abikoensis]GGP53610.1 O-methyltransferase [Streptomyces abikoensis]
MDPATTPAHTPETAPEPPLDPSGALRLMEETFGFLHSAALRTAARLRLADHLADGPRTPNELAGATGTDATTLRRLLRLLASRDVFQEDEAGAFGLTPAASALRTGIPGSLHDAVLLLTDDMFLRPAADLAETVRTGESAFPRVFGTPFFEHLRTDDAAREVFDAGMAAFSGPLDDVVAAAYPFPDHGTVVDVGGGRGGLLRSVLLRHPGLSGVLFDQAPALREPLLAADELTGRWRAEPGDFFTAVPKGDVHLLKHVLPDWSDDDCVRILRSCRQALAPGGRVLVIDAAPPPGNAPHPGKDLDLLMLTALGGSTRTPTELATLFTRSGLRHVRTLPTPGFASIVEAEAAPLA